MPETFRAVAVLHILLQLFLCLTIPSFIPCWSGPVHTANHLLESTFILTDGLFAFLQSFIPFPVVLDFWRKKRDIDVN